MTTILVWAGMGVDLRLVVFASPPLGCAQVQLRNFLADNRCRRFRVSAGDKAVDENRSSAPRWAGRGRFFRRFGRELEKAIAGSGFCFELARLCAKQSRRDYRNG